MLKKKPKIYLLDLYGIPEDKNVDEFELQFIQEADNEIEMRIRLYHGENCPPTFEFTGRIFIETGKYWRGVVDQTYIPEVDLEKMQIILKMLQILTDELKSLEIFK